MIPSGRERERGSGEETTKMDREADGKVRVRERKEGEGRSVCRETRWVERLKRLARNMLTFFSS